VLFRSLGDLACVAGEGAAASGASAPRIAVTYFEVLSDERSDVYLAAGLTDDLIVDLTRVEGVMVASREEVRAFRDRGVPPRTLARELGADYVLLGSVRRAGNRARISAQLARASDGVAIWAERFDRTLDDLFEVQAEVSKRIVSALQVALRPGEREMLDRAPTLSAEAYTFYLRARELMDHRLREDNLRAEELLKRAVEIDPAFALAHAALGECYGERGQNWWTDLEEAAEKALVHAQRALELEPNLLEAQLARAMVHRLRGESGELLAAAERIIALDPECVRALVWAGWSYMALGKPELAVGIWEKLVARPSRAFNFASTLAMVYELLGRPDDVARLRRQAVDDDLEFLQRNPDHFLARVCLGVDLIKLGQRDAGIAQVERSLRFAVGDGRIRYNAACAFAQAGLLDRAMAELKEGIKNLRTYANDWIQHDPDLAPLQDHPEFIRLFGHR